MQLDGRMKGTRLPQQNINLLVRWLKLRYHWVFYYGNLPQHPSKLVVEHIKQTNIKGQAESDLKPIENMWTVESQVCARKHIYFTSNNLPRKVVKYSTEMGETWYYYRLTQIFLTI